MQLFVCSFVCLSPKYKNAIFSKTKHFRAMVSVIIIIIFIFIIIIINVKIIVTLSQKMLQGHCTKHMSKFAVNPVQQIDSAIMSGLQRMP